MTQHRAFDGTLSDRRAVGYQAAYAFAERAQAIEAVIGDREVVYAIRLAEDVVKIGHTGNFRSRRRQFGAGTKLLAFKFGTLDDEQAIHADLAPHRARGREYYNPTAEVLDVVNQMRATLGMSAVSA